MIDGRSFYTILEVENTATQKEIKKSFRRLSKQYHPDLSKLENAAILFDEITKAYDVLSDETLREEYDKRLKGTNNNVAFNEIFSKFKENQSKANGQHVLVNVSVTVEAMSQSKKVKFNYSRKVSCECEESVFCINCSGTGKVLDELQMKLGNIQHTKVCPKCQGSGRIIKHEEGCDGVEKVEKVTKEVDLSDKKFGERYHFIGEGDQGKNGGKNGDLIVEFSFNDEWAKAKNEYRINKNGEVYKEIEVDLADILNPDNFEVTLPNGEVTQMAFQSERIGDPIYFANKSFDGKPTVLYFKIRMPKLTEKQKKNIYNVLKDIK